MAAPNPNEPKSVTMIIKQRQMSRSSTTTPKTGGRNSAGPSGSNVNDNLNPVLPPLYPPAPKPAPVDPDIANSVKVYTKLSQYFKSNFSVEHKSKSESSGFHVERYTDQYKSPLALKPHLVYRLPDSCFPDELTKPLARKPAAAKEMKRKVEDLPDGEEGEKPLLVPKEEEEDNDEEEKEEANVDEVDENEEDIDEEMDVGTDYALSYFDNGEGDDDDRDDDDGPTY